MVKCYADQMARAGLQRTRVATIATTLVVVCCVLHLRLAAAQHAARELPDAMDQWWYGVNISTLRHSMEQLPVKRLWTREDLHVADGVSTVLNFEQLRPLINRLNSGQPINVVAFGDSVTASFGGCFHSSVQSVVRELPSALTSKLPGDRFGRGWKKVTEKVSDCVQGMPLGWLTGFMTALNTTWPHVDHLLINNGMSGGTWGALSEVCLEHRLPKRTDLLILEHYPLLEGASPLDLERLLHNLRLFFGGRLPPILFLNLMRAANAMPHDPTAQCISGPMSKCAPGQPCVAAFADRPWQGDIDHFRHNETQTVARHYGLSSLSHIHVVAHLARKLEQQGINRCQLLCSLNMDPLHPREMGRMLLADLLTDHVQRAVKWLQATPPPAVRPSVAPMDPQSLHVRRMVCYSGTGTDVDNRQVKVLSVIKAEGWVQELREGHDFWPGWIATMAGAVLWIRLDASDVPGQVSEHHHARSQGHNRPGGASQGAVAMDVRINHLRSWHHMGQVEVSCVQGCTCKESVFDGHETGGQWTVPATHDVGNVWLPSTARRLAQTAHADSSAPHVLLAPKLDVSDLRRKLQQSSSAECVLQLRVLSTTTSGEHRAVVSSLNMGAWRDLTSDLSAPLGL